MNADPHRVAAIVAAAQGLPTSEDRAAYLDEACASDVALREQVEALLTACEAAGDLPTGLTRGLGDTVESPPGQGAGDLDAFAPTLDAAGPMPSTEHLGTHIGPYKLLQKIGEGGMGSVYLAEQEVPVRRRVALKIIKAGMDSAQVIARFEGERQALALMDHPNIAKVLDAGTTDAGRPYFVMELVKGIPLTRYCDQEHLTLRERLELFIPVCQAVQHAHQKGIIHRDLKPSNVLIALYDAKPVPKVIDFGLAKATRAKLTERTMYTQVGGIVGTLEYMAPEQAEPNNADIDTRADIYSLGVILYELLAGTTPFGWHRLREAPFTEVIRIIQQEEPRRPSDRIIESRELLPSLAAQRGVEPAKLPELVRRELDWIVMKCLEKDRDRRYETANALARDIERHLHDEPVLACPPSRWYRFRKFARRNKVALATATVMALAVLVTVAALAVSNVRITEEKNQKDIALGEKDIALGEKEVALGEKVEALKQARIQEGRANESAQTAETQRGIAVEKEKTAKTNELLARRRFYDAQINLAHQAWEAGDLARTLAILETQRPRFDEDDLRSFEWYCLWKLCHQRLRFSWQLKSGNSYAVACSADGTLLACAGSDGRVRLFETTTSKERSALQEKSYGSVAIAFSPDGRLLAQAAGPTEDEVTLWDVAAGRQQSVLKGTGKVGSLAFAPDGRTLATGNQDGVVQLWDVATSRLRTSLQEAPRPVSSVAFSPDSKVLVASWPGMNRIARLFDVTVVPAAPLQHIPLQQLMSAGRSLAFSADGKLIAVTCSSGNPFALFDLSTLKPLPVKQTGTGWEVGSTLAVSPDGKAVAVAAGAKCVKLVDIVTGEQQALPHHALVESVGFSGDGKLLASVSQDAVLKLWDLSRTGAAEVVDFPASRSFIAMSPDSKKVAIYGDGDVSWTLFVKDLASRHLMTLTGHPQTNVWSVAFSPDSRYLASGSRPAVGSTLGDFKLWDLTTGREVAEFPRMSVDGVAFSPRGDTLATSGGGTLILWDVATRKARVTLKEATWISALAFSPDGKTLICARKGSIDFRSSASGEKRLSLKGPDATGRGRDLFVICSPDGKLLAGCQDDGSVYVLDLATGRLRVSLHGNSGGIGAAAFFPDNNTLATASLDGMVRLWDVATGQERLTFKGALRLAVSPDGKLLAMVTNAGVRLYRAATDREATAYRSELNPGDPESPVTQLNAADLLWAAGQNEEAQEACEKARLRLEKLATQFPDNSDYKRELARQALTPALVLSGSEQAAERESVRVRAMTAFKTLPAEDQQALVRRYIDLGESLRTAGRNPEAEKAYDLAIELKPDDPSAWFRRAYAYAELQQFEKALADYAKVTELNPKWSGAWNNRGAIYFRLGQEDKALAEFARAVEVAPKDALPWQNRARLYARQKQWDKAVADYSKALELAPNDLEILNSRAIGYQNLRQWDQAVADYSKAIELKPSELKYWFVRGLAYLNLRQADKAASDFSKVIELDEKNAAAWHNRGLAHERLRKLDKALPDFSKAIELAPKTALHWQNRGRIQRELEQFEKALADFDMAIELNQKDAEAWRERALTHADMKQWDYAATDLSQLIELKPQDWSPRRMRGYAYAKLDRWDEAAADFAKAVELGGKDRAAWISVGNTFREFGRLEEAVRHYAKAIELNPKDAEAWFERGSTRMTQAEWEQAVSDFSKVIELATEEKTGAIVFRRRALALTQLGRFPDALSDYQKSLKRAPKDPLAHNDLAWFLATCPSVALRDPKRAVELARNAVELAPKAWAIQNTLGVAYYYAGDWKAAIETLNKAMELRKGGDAFDWFFLAMAHWKLDQKEEARKRYDDAVQWIDKNKEALEKDKQHTEELRRFRAEAAALLGVEKKKD